MHRVIRVGAALVVLPVMLIALGWASSTDDQSEILKVRETVWRAWFADDTKTLKELVPSNTIVISAGEAKWKNQAEVFQSAAEFHAAGGTLIRIEFPRTEIQRYGEVAIIWRVSGRNGNKRQPIVEFRSGHRDLCSSPRTMDQSRLAHRLDEIRA